MSVVKEWFVIAIKDLRAAKALAEVDESFLNQVSFHLQQYSCV